MRYAETTTPEERRRYKRWRKRIADDVRAFRAMTGAWPEKKWIHASKTQAALRVLQEIDPQPSILDIAKTKEDP